MQKQPQTGLTSNQEKFVQALLKGKTQRQAYYEAYPKSRLWNENRVDNNASVLYRNAKVLARISELRAKIIEKQDKKLIFDAKQLMEFWTSILSSEEYNLQNRIKASELLAKAQGVFVEKRETKITNDDCVIRIMKNDD